MKHTKWLFGGLGAVAVLAAVLYLSGALRAVPGFALFGQNSPPGAITFDDSDPNALRITNSYYQVDFSRANGVLQAITDRGSGKQLLGSSQSGCLWAIQYSPTPFGTLDGCRPSGGFTYAWLPGKHQLELRYGADPVANTGEAVVVVSASSERWLGLQLRYDNVRGGRPELVRFPDGFTFQADKTTNALLPLLPGVMLEPGFFTLGRGYQANYPGSPGVFADFFYYSVEGGSLALYSIPESDRLLPVTLGIDSRGCLPAGQTCLTHRYNAGPAPKSKWTSPALRLWISEPVEQVIVHLREDGGIAKTASLPARLGASYTKLAEAPLYKADAFQLGLPFDQYAALLDSLPVPGLLHPVGYMPGGHDHSYPDFLPPDPAFGTTQAMAAMVKLAQARGFLVMPYTNPTWWDSRSPTLQKLPKDVTLKNLAALTSAFMPIEECYGCPDNPHEGVVVSPFAPFTRQRLKQAMEEMTGTLKVDLVFEDQIGARPALQDYNAASPSPEAYMQGWVEHTRAYQSARLMTEQGYDRLVGSVIGFHGGLWLSDRTGSLLSSLPSGVWHYYPFTGMLARDKAFFYQHDLAPESFTTTPTTFAWNVALGYMFSIDLYPSNFGGGPQDPWMAVAADFQKNVLGAYAAERITNFELLGVNVTRTSFGETFSALVNRDVQAAYESGGYTLPPFGVLITNKDGSLVAGAFTRFTGQPLSPGSHYLIEQRGAKEIIIWQPMGADTDLLLPAINGWTAAAGVQAWAFDRAGKCLAATPAQITSAGASFQYQRSPQGNTAGGSTAYYRLFIPKKGETCP